MSVAAPPDAAGPQCLPRQEQRNGRGTGGERKEREAGSVEIQIYLEQMEKKKSEGKRDSGGGALTPNM